MPNNPAYDAAHANALSRGPGVLSIWCGDDGHDRCNGWFVLWACSCPCHRAGLHHEGYEDGYDAALREAEDTHAE
jgi:hypothetical protein